MKNWILLFVLLLALVALLLAPQPAHAAGVCPAPGTGLPGALNMIHDATMGATMQAHVAPQGNAGMATAVQNSGC